MIKLLLLELPVKTLCFLAFCFTVVSLFVDFFD